jgi:mRNA interferase MazF
VEAVTQGEVWWADLGMPRGSAAGFRRPIVIVQGDELNRTGIATVISIPLTTNLRWANALGNVLLEPEETGLPNTSVVNVSQIFTVDRQYLLERAGKLSRANLDRVLAGIDVILGR